MKQKFLLKMGILSLALVFGFVVMGCVMVSGTTTSRAVQSGNKVTVSGIGDSWNGKKARIALYGDDYTTELIPDSQFLGSSDISGGSVTVELSYAALGGPTKDKFGDNVDGNRFVLY